MKHFTFGEFEKSATAYKHGIDNTAPEEARRNIAALVDNVLDPLRQAWGGPILVSSGYRCPKLNALVGGAKNSQHMTGCAADLRVVRNGAVDTVANRRLFQLIRSLHLPFDQLIDERDFSWIHVSHRRDGDNRNQILKL